jgi:hypothetical protein
MALAVLYVHRGREHQLLLDGAVVHMELAAALDLRVPPQPRRKTPAGKFPYL